MANTPRQGRIFLRFADSVGDGSGSRNAIGDYSSVPSTFFIKPTVDETFRLSLLMISYRSMNEGSATDYASMVPLTNGIQIHIVRDGEVTNDLTFAGRIFDNAGWETASEFYTRQRWLGNIWTYNAVIPIAKSGQSFRLAGEKQEELQIILNDDFTSLERHVFGFYGYDEKKQT